MVQVVETKDQLTYAVVQHLMAKHFIGVDPLHANCNHQVLISLNRNDETDSEKTDSEKTDDPED